MKTQKINLILFFFTILILVSKISFNPFNLEWLFLDLGNYLSKRNDYLIDLYSFKKYQLNTSFYSFLISLLNFDNFIVDYKFIRFINIILSIIFCLIIFLFISSELKKDERIFLSFYIFLSPIIFLISSKIFPDFLSLVIALLSLYLFKKKKYYFSFFSLIFATLIKPICLCLIPIYFYYHYCDSKKIFDTKLIFFFLSPLIIFFLSLILNGE